MARQEWFTAKELAGLPGLPGTERAIQLKGKKNLLTTRSKELGKGLEYARADLPAETREYLDKRDQAEALALMGRQASQPEASSAGVTAGALTVVGRGEVTPAAGNCGALAMQASQADRCRWLAREMVVRTIEDMVQTTRKSVRQVVAWLLAEAEADRMPAAMLTKLREAADERGRSAADRAALPSAPTLERWVSQKRAGAALLPRSSALQQKVAAWYAPFFGLCDRPQKPTLKKSWELLLENWRPEWADPPGSQPPSYDACVRAYKKRSEIDKIKGQHTGSELKAKTFYHRRTYEGLAPFSEVHSDGWNTHFSAPDEAGKFRTYEVWHARCVATKVIPPFAIGYTETTDLILKCMRLTVEMGGLVAIWQTDSTKAVKGNARVMDELTGVTARLGMTIVHPQEVGNSQANGIAENFNTWLDREARELATYQNPKVMDNRTFVRMKRITNQMVKAAGHKDRETLRQQAVREGKGLVFDSRASALNWLETKRVKWNNHHHRELPKIKCPDTGRLRHMTPLESLDAAKAAGWEPATVPAELLADAFRPHLVKKVTRGTVTPFGGMRYRHPALDALMNREVQVAVDPEDFARVWIKDLDGRLLCVADHVPDVQSRSQTMRDAADAKRAAARIRLRERQIEAIEEEISPQAHIEMSTPSVVVVPANFGQPRQAEPVPAAQEYPQAENPMEVYLRRRVAEKRAQEAQAELDALARIEAAMNGLGDEGDDTDFEAA